MCLFYWTSLIWLCPGVSLLRPLCSLPEPRPQGQSFHAKPTKVLTASHLLQIQATPPSDTTSTTTFTFSINLVPILPHCPSEMLSASPIFFLRHFKVFHKAPSMRQFAIISVLPSMIFSSSAADAFPSEYLSPLSFFTVEALPMNLPGSSSVLLPSCVFLVTNDINGRKKSVAIV